MRNKLLIIGIVSFVLLAGLFYFLYLNQGHNWRITYDHNADSPYGTRFIKTLLANLHVDQELTVNDKPLKLAINESQEAFNYVRIDRNADFSKEGIKQLAQHVFDGNKAFIATASIPKRLLGRILDPGNKAYYYNKEWLEQDSGAFPLAKFSTYNDTGVQMRISNPVHRAKVKVHFYMQKRYNRSSHRWTYIDSLKDVTALDRIAVLGKLHKDKPNFLKIDFGEGAFFFHFSPIVFTNYHINRKEGFTYAREAFAGLDNKPILFDPFEPAPEPKTVERNNRNYGNSPLQFILSQPALRWAWYWGLLTILLFILFRAKRRQRIIPVLANYSNETLAFVESLGRLHKRHKAIQSMAVKLMGIFLNYLREHYNLQTNVEEEQLSMNSGAKAGIDPQLVRNIFTKYHEIQRQDNQELTEADLRTFYGMIHNFFQKSK